MRNFVFVTFLSLAWIAAGSAHAADAYAKYDDHSAAGLTRVAGTEYVNRNYGYTVAIPSGEAAWMNRAPSPNHGIRIFLGAQRSIEVDASFDAALLGSTSAVADDAAMIVGGRQVSKSQDALGGQPSERMSIVGPGDRRRIIVARWSDQGKDDAINYVVTLETTAAAYDHDRRIFDTVVRSFASVARGP